MRNALFGIEKAWNQDISHGYYKEPGYFNIKGAIISFGFRLPA